MMTSTPPTRLTTPKCRSIYQTCSLVVPSSRCMRSTTRRKSTTPNRSSLLRHSPPRPHPLRPPSPRPPLRTSRRRPTWWRRLSLRSRRSRTSTCLRRRHGLRALHRTSHLCLRRSRPIEGRLRRSARLSAPRSSGSTRASRCPAPGKEQPRTRDPQPCRLLLAPTYVRFPTARARQARLAGQHQAHLPPRHPGSARAA
ncbi:hypothetical protein K523DRAFT_4421 [Schizophyllum commune Tattone D]|nr:hypothetical protein K523DRAFT_4421 [Schizophyllum commune Tattone D]